MADRKAAFAQYAAILQKRADAGASSTTPPKKPSLSVIVFEKYDLGNKGFWDESDFERFLTEKHYYFSEQELALGFIKADENSDGKITYDEFRNWWSNDNREKEMELSDSQLQMVDIIIGVFNSCDKNKDGKLDQTEIKQLAKFLVSDPNLHVLSETFLQELDTNSSGFYELSEILRFVLMRGLLTEDE
eukprot:maker-scaffold_16-snap-gene-5.10-mRNA-1 protein AED:0.37 eAED:0.37 QI:148/1/1/1/1/1/2/48/188